MGVNYRCKIPQIVDLFVFLSLSYRGNRRRMKVNPSFPPPLLFILTRGIDPSSPCQGEKDLRRKSEGFLIFFSEMLDPLFVEKYLCENPSERRHFRLPESLLQGHTTKDESKSVILRCLARCSFDEESGFFPYVALPLDLFAH